VFPGRDLREISHLYGGGATRCRCTTSSPRPVIRCTSPKRAPWSGRSARRVVAPGPGAPTSRAAAVSVVACRRL